VATRRCRTSRRAHGQAAVLGCEIAGDNQSTDPTHWSATRITWFQPSSQLVVGPDVLVLSRDEP